MAKRLRDSCGLTESEALWKISRGFVVRDLPWTEHQLRKLPPFEFENWAVIAVGGTPNKVHTGDMGMDGIIYPISSLPERRSKADQLAFMDVWYPIQVKQSDKVGRPDIDKFEAVLMRENRTRGYFVGFDFTGDALQEIGSFFKRSGREIVHLTVQQILDENFTGSRIPPKPASVLRISEDQKRKRR
jgi:hypothetical protein